MPATRVLARGDVWKAADGPLACSSLPVIGREDRKMKSQRAERTTPTSPPPPEHGRRQPDQARHRDQDRLAEDYEDEPAEDEEDEQEWLPDRRPGRATNTTFDSCSRRLSGFPVRSPR